MQLAIKTKSLLPETLSHILASPSSNELEQLLWRYQSDEKYLKEADEFLSSGKHTGSIGILMQSGLVDAGQPIQNPLSNRSLEKGIKILQKNYWDKAIRITDVLEHMPQARKKEWSESLDSFDFPEFTLENIIETLSVLMSERDKFFAEYVEGVFESLSGEHVTNQPSGFYKRMIMAHVHEGGWPCSSKCGYISDLRKVIAKFMGRELGRFGSVDTYDLIKALYKNHTGKWVDIDGGSLRIKTYLKGTVHIEIHPDLAWQLNEVLSILYPRAIPSEFRKRNTKKIKTFNLSQNLLGFDVINALTEFQEAYKPIRNDFRGRWERIPNTFNLKNNFGLDKHLKAKVYDVLTAIGGTQTSPGNFTFDYNPLPIVESIVITGSIPDKYSHQFYPTPSPVVDKMVDKLGASAGDRVLEPSAGIGSIAVQLDGEVACVEVSSVHCEILKKKGLSNVVHADFLLWAETARASGVSFDKVCMNPPFSLGRAEMHVTSALSLLKAGGTLVSLVPASLAEKMKGQGDYNIDAEPVPYGEFKGVSVGLSIITIRK